MRFLHLLWVVAAITLVSACEDDSVNKSQPIIVEVRNYAASPDDTTVQSVSAGQWVVLMGNNLSGATQVNFGGVPATINNSYFTDHSLVVQVPSIPFELVPPGELNKVTVYSPGGVATLQIEVTGAPLITRVRNFAPAPDDTVAGSIVPDQHINIIGYNLKNATSISFQGKQADLSGIVYTDSSAIVRVPQDLSGGDASLANTISYTTDLGTGTFSIRIIGPPIIMRVSLELPNAGDSVRLYGNNFISVETLTFAGADITEYKVSSDGNSIGFVAPALTQAGPVSITTIAGSFTTAYNVNDVNTGAISTFEWGDNFRWDWWGGAELNSGDPASGWPPYNADVPGNTGMFLLLKNNALAADAGDEYGNAIRIPAAQWVPQGNLGDAAGSWALKFEVNVPKDWKGGTISIKTSNDSYRARYEPWQVSPTKTITYRTKGWQTITIPLSAFRLEHGQGAPVSNLAELLGNTGSSALILYMHNYGTATTATSFYAAFDNFRVVRM